MNKWQTRDWRQSKGTERYDVITRDCVSSGEHQETENKDKNKALAFTLPASAPKGGKRAKQKKE